MALSLNKPAFHIALLIVVSMAVSSCGRRGNLQAPGTIQTDDTQQVEQTEVEEVKEDKPFILDGLL